jgi:hypothetical protein
VRVPRYVNIAFILLAIHAPGCGGEDETNKPVDMKPADTSQFKGMLEQQTKDLTKGKKAAIPKP